MSTITVSKLGAWSLILGSPLALVFFLLQPGGLLVDSAPSTDAVASITSLASNAALSKLTTLVISLGLVVGLYGLFVLRDGVRDEGAGDALARYGVLLLTITTIGWVMLQGTKLVLADTQLQSVQAMVPVYEAGLGISLVSTFTAALGYLTLSIGLATRGDFNKTISWVAAIASIIALVGLIVRISSPDVAETAMTIVRACYFFWVLWSIVIGSSLLKRA